jgi:FixJ family two-component response regulator
MSQTMLERAGAETESDAKHNVRSILIVDDEANFRRGVQRLFYLLGNEVVFRGYEASGGDEALNVLKRHPVDCVLLDYHMVGCNGLEVLSRIFDFNRNLPVIMVTGAGDEEIAVAALKSGAVDYLVKGSITQDGLRRSILNAIEKATMRETLERQRAELLEAERQKAMIQSLGAACHHLGQPATTLQCCLELLQRLNLASDVKELVSQGNAAMLEMSETLHDLQRVCAFSTTTYRARSAGEPERPDEDILKIA